MINISQFAKNEKDKITLENAELVGEIEQIVKNGIESELEEDDILQEIFEKGTPFSVLEKVYNYIGRELGLLLTPAETKAKIAELIDKVSFEKMTSWNSVEEFCNYVKENVKGVSFERALSNLRKKAESIEFELPTKPAEHRGPRGVIKGTYMELFTVNPETSFEELVEALTNAGIKPDNAKNYAAQWHEVLSTIAKR